MPLLKELTRDSFVRGYQIVMMWFLLSHSLLGVFVDSFSAPAAGPLKAGVKRNVGVLPFRWEEALLPGEERYLHLYEARFLSLFEAATQQESEVALAFSTGEALCSLGTLAKIDSWEKLEVGVGATIRGLCRIEIESIGDNERFIIANGTTVVDDFDDAESASRVAALCREVSNLSAKHDIAKPSSVIDVDPRAVLVSTSQKSFTEKKELISDLEMQSFGALSGATTHNRMRGLTSPDQRRRWSVAEVDLKAQRDNLAAKAAIKSLDLKWE